jgi:hypothetical protein
MPLHWWIYQILDYGGKHEGIQHQIPLKNSLRQNSSWKAPLQMRRSNTSWTGFLLCLTHTMVKSEYEYILITVWVTSTLLWEPPPGFMYFTSVISQITYFCQNWHKAFSICMTIQREMGQCHWKPKRRETYIFYTLIISAVSCRKMHETWGDSEVWRIEKPLALKNQCLINRTFYTTWFYHHCGYITKKFKNQNKTLCLNGRMDIQ